MRWIYTGPDLEGMRWTPNLKPVRFTIARVRRKLTNTIKRVGKILQFFLHFFFSFYMFFFIQHFNIGLTSLVDQFFQGFCNNFFLIIFFQFPLVFCYSVILNTHIDIDLKCRILHQTFMVIKINLTNNVIIGKPLLYSVFTMINIKYLAIKFLSKRRCSQ